MRVAVYTKNFEELLGTLELRGDQVVAVPPQSLALDEQEKTVRLHQLHYFLERKRPRGMEDNETWLRNFPRIWRDMGSILQDGEDPQPGFDDLANQGARG